MAGWITQCAACAGAYGIAWRRARNLGAGLRQRRRAARPRDRARRLALAGWLLAALAGGGLIAAHARQLGTKMGAGDGHDPAALFQQVLPGQAFDVGREPGVRVQASRAGTLLVAAGMRGAAPARIDLCGQAAGDGSARLAPVRIGYPFARIAGLAGGGTLRGVIMGSPASPDLPRVTVSGTAQALSVRWEGQAARWTSDASGGTVASGGAGRLANEGWLLWHGGALRFTRRPGRACPAGELSVQLLRPEHGNAARALVVAFPASGQVASGWFSPGSYRIPLAPPARLEDEALFRELLAQRMLRMGAGGLAELAPRDLAAWREAPAAVRVADLAGWSDAAAGDEAQRLSGRLYRMADGEYVRRQVALYNSERRMLAWRTGAASPAGRWLASVDGVAVPLAAAMPPLAATLFSELPTGWAPWRRVAAWPGGADTARLSLVLARPARSGERLDLMLAGRLESVQGARLLGSTPACSGRSCPDRQAVVRLALAIEPGARAVTLAAAPVALPPPEQGDLRYRHLLDTGGQLAWQDSHRAGRAQAAIDTRDVALSDRAGVPLLRAGRPTARAAGAGLATLVGVHPAHSSGVAGMLARLPGPPVHEARLTIDYAIQAAAQAVLDCVALRGGKWDGKACHASGTAPPGRRAGLVILDTDNGDVLAAAGAGGPDAQAAAWHELRDFDRASPAGSPLRLPALQHGGGVHHSPGSTFKVVTALGLEMAALRDQRIDALLAGMAPGAIDRIAAQRGFPYRMAAAAYPHSTQRAHITNYRHDLPVRRSEHGRFGLAAAMAHSVNTWFAWSGEMADRTLLGRAEGGVPGIQALEPDALDTLRPVAAAARLLGFGEPLRLDGGLLPADYRWGDWDALSATASRIDPVRNRHELRQMAIGLRMQATPLQMALVAAAVGEGRVVAPRLLLSLDGEDAHEHPGQPLPVRLDRIRAGMKRVVDAGTAASAFGDASLAAARRGLYGKTGTAPAVARAADGTGSEVATAWFIGWIEPGTLPGQSHRLAFAVYASHSGATGGAHAAPVMASLLRHWPRPAGRAR